MDAEERGAVAFEVQVRAATLTEVDEELVEVHSHALRRACLKPNSYGEHSEYSDQCKRHMVQRGRNLRGGGEGSRDYSESELSLNGGAPAIPRAAAAGAAKGAEALAFTVYRLPFAAVCML
ncbi:MAG: hypothetical protein AMXMBFR7_01340 [Planctomycetota bacterium]